VSTEERQFRRYERRYQRPVKPCRTNNIRLIRLARRMPIESLAARAGMSVSSLYRWEIKETASISVRVLILLARALRCRPTDLVPALGALYGPKTTEEQLRQDGFITDDDRPITDESEVVARGDFRAAPSSLVRLGDQIVAQEDERREREGEGA